MKCVWVMMLFLHCSSALEERFQVVGPDAPVVGKLGSDVVLPCSVRRLADQSSLSAVDMYITWTRSGLGDALVHFYGDNKYLNARQSPDYRWRTALFKEELQNGNTSLSLSEVKAQDEGEYRCHVESDFWADQVYFNLKVEAVGERPVITLESYNSNQKSSVYCVSLKAGGLSLIFSG
ncbi:myelin-oligodendrocyte glycoprotein-like [Colossoma macropomum]|uniref:myelin-oligodendrocyte glycoprotein-like n=1 Tax=Colossoma macropomum TaxID=42526 RepID=UPI001864C806|nr:myelin-oligodendrocyte glycoprotein-like [Colossoma macropomum]